MPQGKSKHASLTETFVKRLTPRTATQTIDYYDTRLANLSLRSSPPSKQHRHGLLTWRFGFRLNGTPGVVTIGRYPTWSADAALKEARELQVKVDRGIDPRRRGEAVAAPGAKPTIDTVAKMFDRYEPQLSKKSGSYYRNTTAHFTRFIIPAWTGVAIQKVTRRDAADLLTQVRTENGRVLANRVASSLSSWGNFLIGEGVLESSPFTRLTKTEEKPRSRTPTMAELVRIWHAVTAIGYPIEGFVKLLILTGTRRRESAELPRGEVTGGEWLLPIDRNKSGRRDFLILLSTQAQAVLAACPDLGRHYFSTGAQKPLSGFGHVKKTIDAKIVELTKPGEPALAPWVFHDFRRSFRSGLSQLKVDPALAERLMNHAVDRLEGTYNTYAYREEKAAAWQKWADRLDQALAAAAQTTTLEEAAE